MTSPGPNGQPREPQSVLQPPSDWVTRQFARWETPLVAYTCRRLSGDFETARDVVQEAFFKLCQQAWPDIEAQAAAWLYKTCRNRAIDICRREGRMPKTHAQLDITNLRDQSQHQPDDRAQQVELMQRLQAAMDRLPDPQQEILRLRLQAGLSYKQIAEVTGLTASNVGYHLHQAVCRLRDSLGAERNDHAQH